MIQKIKLVNKKRIFFKNKEDKDDFLAEFG